MRFGCCLVAVSLAMSCFATPRAKAVVTEGALLGSIFGSLLVSMGFSWAADNMDVPTFGESIYKLIQEHDEANKDTGVQLIRDLNIAALISGRPGTIQFNYAWTQAARSFAEWFQGKFFTGESSSVVVCPGSAPSITTIDGVNISLTTLSDYSSSAVVNLSPVSLGSNLFEVFNIDTSASGVISTFHLTENVTLRFDSSNGFNVLYTPGEQTIFSSKFSYVSNGYVYPVLIALPDGKLGYGSYFTSSHPNSSVRGLVSYSSTYQVAPTILSLTDLGIVESSSLSAEKPAEVHYPDVAEDGSQVYEVTYQGVTATDIEGIIQGAVDRILAGTAAIAGEVTQAQDVPAEPEVPPELDGLDLPALGAALTSRFPFSIPWDVARGISLLAAPAEAPYWEVDFLAPIAYRVGGWGGSTTVVLDFSEFEILGQLSRWMSTIGFCLMLAASTKRLIWVA